MHAQRLFFFLQQFHKAFDAQIFKEEFEACLHASGSLAVAVEYPEHTFDERNDLVFMKKVVNGHSEVRVGTQSSTDIHLKAALIVTYLGNESYVVNERKGCIVFA